MTYQPLQSEDQTLKPVATGALGFYMAEALRIHALLDRAGVPRTSGGEPMSMSQRVEEAMLMLRLPRKEVS